MTEHQLFLFLAEVVVVVVAARAGGELAIRLGVAEVVGELIVGILLGPSLFGKVWPSGFAALFPADPVQRDLLEIVSWIGVILIVLLSGFDARLGLVKKAGKAVVASWIGGFVLPFALGFALGMGVPESLMGGGVSRTASALFLGVAMSVSAIPVIARILLELDLLQTRTGMVIISTAVADDTVGWVALALVTGLIVDHKLAGRGVLVAIVGAAAFLALSFTVGQRFVRRAFAASSVLRIPYGQATLTLAIVFVAGAITQAIHLHLVLGAFVAGILIFRTPWRTRDLEAISALRRVGMSFFVPFFFSYSGLRVDLTTLTGSTLAVAVIAIVVACAGKLVGGGLGARLGGLSFWEAAAVGAGRNARGASGLVIASIGLSIRVLTLPMYSIVVLMAVVTALMAGPLLRYCAGKGEVRGRRVSGRRGGDPG